MTWSKVQEQDAQGGRWRVERQPLKPDMLGVEQVEFLELIDSLWREKNEWPKRKQLGFRLEKRGIKIDAAQKLLPSGLIQSIDAGNQEGERLRLTVAGLERTTRGAAEAAEFVRFVRLGLERYLADRRTVWISTRADPILASSSANDRERVIELFKLDWSGRQASEPDGFWKIGIEFEQLKLVRMVSAGDYMAQRWSTVESARALSEPHLELLKEIYQQRRQTGAWPDVRTFILEHTEPADVLRLIEEIAAHKHPVLLQHFSTHEHEKHHRSLKLTLDAVIFPRSRGQFDYAASTAIRALNSYSMGLR